jgi:hypothetical protein
MSHKQSKLLRKLMGYHPSSPREYSETVVKTVAVPTGRLNEDGSEQMTFHTHVLRVNTGKRKAYQEGKKVF